MSAREARADSLLGLDLGHDLISGILSKSCHSRDRRRNLSLVRMKRSVPRIDINIESPSKGCAETMPRFFFDLFYDRYVVLDPGGMSFEYPARATEAADELARDLLMARSELRKSGSWIRVRDERGTEVYRSSIDPETPAPIPAL
jgi:uncharacterized protein DUF6894